MKIIQNIGYMMTSSNHYTKSGLAKKYSARLDGYLRHQSPRKFQCFRKNDNGKLVLGFISDGDLLGTRMRDVIRTGGNVRLLTMFDLGSYTLVPDFWEEYSKKGICLIDPEHIHYPFRWKEFAGGHARKCAYCSVSQRKEEYVITSKHTRWVGA